MKWNEICIYKLVKEPSFSLNWQFWFFKPNLEKVISKKEKKVNIFIELCIFGLFLVSNFGLNWQFYIFLAKFHQKSISGLKITLARASKVVTYYIKLFGTGADKYSSILMSLLLVVAKTERWDN